MDSLFSCCIALGTWCADLFLSTEIFTLSIVCASRFNHENIGKHSGSLLVSVSNYEPWNHS